MQTANVHLREQLERSQAAFIFPIEAKSFSIQLHALSLKVAKVQDYENSFLIKYCTEDPKFTEATKPSTSLFDCFVNVPFKHASLKFPLEKFEFKERVVIPRGCCYYFVVYIAKLENCSAVYFDYRATSSNPLLPHFENEHLMLKNGFFMSNAMYYAKEPRNFVGIIDYSVLQEVDMSKALHRGMCYADVKITFVK